MNGKKPHRMSTDDQSNVHFNKSAKYRVNRHNRSVIILHNTKQKECAICKLCPHSKNERHWEPWYKC